MEHASEEEEEEEEEGYLLLGFKCHSYYSAPAGNWRIILQ